MNMNNLSPYVNKTLYKAKVYLKLSGMSIAPSAKNKIVNQFHKLFYDSHVLGKTWGDAKFLGTPIQKCPFDLFVYQEILYEVQPDVIIEAGTEFGGGALYLASICDLIGKGRVVTIDIKDIPRPKHKRIKYLIGSSTDKNIVNQVKKSINRNDKVMVILDSDHSHKHVSNELILYNKFVTKGSYLIIEDTNINGHPVNPDYGPGPMEAVTEFLRKNNNFIKDSKREKFLFTFNPNGYLRRIK